MKMPARMRVDKKGCIRFKQYAENRREYPILPRECINLYLPNARSSHHCICPFTTES